MNERIKLLAKQAGGNPNYKAFYGHFLPPPPDYIDPATVDLEKFAELIVQECARLNLELSYELAGVIVDTEEGIGFDSVCLNTVKQVHNSLASRQLTEHFGVEE